MADGGTDIEHPLRHPAGAFFPDPVNKGLAAAIGECSQATRGCRENPAIIIGTGRDIARPLFAMIASGHVMDVDNALIARHIDLRVKLQRVAAFIILARLGLQRVELA